MPIRSHGGYLRLSDYLQTKDTLKNGSESRKGQPASIFTVRIDTMGCTRALFVQTNANVHFKKWRHGALKNITQKATEMLL